MLYYSETKSTLFVRKGERHIFNKLMQKAQELKYAKGCGAVAVQLGQQTELHGCGRCSNSCSMEVFLPLPSAKVMYVSEIDFCKVKAEEYARLEEMRCPVCGNNKEYIVPAQVPALVVVDKNGKVLDYDVVVYEDINVVSGPYQCRYCRYEFNKPCIQEDINQKPKEELVCS